MPPKKQDKAQTKAEAKAKQKVVEDKTFGLKNKNKSKSVQKFIKSVQAQVTGGRVKSEHEIKAEQAAKTEERKKAKQQAALLASLQKAQELLKASKGADQKTNDPVKPDIYVDYRNVKQDDDITQWDQEKLEQVVKTKHGGQRAQSEIVCKYFLDALDKNQYGWFWQCPNGETCHYRHALPPGFVLKRRVAVDANDDGEPAEPLEEILERERAALPPGGTPVTLETFMAWKAKKEKEEADAQEAARKKREKESGRQELSGRALFSLNKDFYLEQEVDDDDDDEFAAMLAARKRADVEEDARMQEQAAANLAAATAAAAATRKTDSTAGEESGPRVQNAAVFTDRTDLDAVNPDDLDD